MSGSVSPATLSAAFRRACMLELAAPKPGNVGCHAPGHGMDVEDFARSADAAAAQIAQPGVSVGLRIRRSIEATRAAVGCNTNLGIVLLAAPLVHAALNEPPPLREALRRVLQALTHDDAEQAYAAIRLAAPAGMGRVDAHDVAQRPSVTLLDAMLSARARDRIAEQYAGGYDEIFEFALPALRGAMQDGYEVPIAVVRIYLGLLARAPDSHVARKHGTAVAAGVSARAARLEQELLESAATPTMLEALMGWDGELKRDGINPGTCADLTVATLLADEIETLQQSFAGCSRIDGPRQTPAHDRTAAVHRGGGRAPAASIETITEGG